MRPLAESFETITVEVRDRLAILTLSRPERRNALNAQMLEELGAAFRWLRDAEWSITCLVVRGSGRSFCAGYDVSGFVRAPGQSLSDTFSDKQLMEDVFSEFDRLNLVKVAAIHGHCVGAGLVLASMCELRFAEPDASFAIPELDAGAPFSLGGIPRLCRLVGLTLTADMVLTGRVVAAGEMHENVYLTDVVPVEELESRALGVAKRCSERPEFLTRATVAALRRAASDLLPIHGSDIDTLVLSEFDQQASARQAAYISRHVVPSSSSS